MVEIPWFIAETKGRHCVTKGTKDKPGEQLKCYDSRDEALKYMRALYMAEEGKEFTKSDAELADVMASLGLDDEPTITATVTNTASPDSSVTVSYEPSSIVSTQTTSTITAHAEPAAPPSSFFTEPPPEFQRRYVTVTDEGRVMGLLATFDECHVGYGQSCVTAPREADYSHFAVGTVLTSDGTTIPTGVIAINGGHADVSLDASSARSHYDDTASGVVDVVVGTSDTGIWFSGALRPGVTEAQVHQLRASGVSGDWRRIDGELRLIGICSVNVPGFPKLRVAASADTIDSLVAAGGPPLPDPSLDCDCHEADILAKLGDIETVLVSSGLMDEAFNQLAERIAADAEFDALMFRIPTDDDFDQLQSRIG